MKTHVDFSKGYLAVQRDQKQNLSKDELRNLEAVAQICDPHLFTNINESIGSGLKTEEIVPLLKNLTMKLNETTLFCKWQNEINLCDAYFTEIITEEGFCYTFNVLKNSELFREEM
jgi:acid-sensing ion channel, other